MGVGKHPNSPVRRFGEPRQSFSLGPRHKETGAEQSLLLRYPFRPFRPRAPPGGNKGLAREGGGKGSGLGEQEGSGGRVKLGTFRQSHAGPTNGSGYPTLQNVFQIREPS